MAGKKENDFFFFLKKNFQHITRVCHYRVPGEIKSREVELDPQPKRDHEQGGGAGLRKLDFFRFRFVRPQQQCNGPDLVFVTAQARQLKQQLRSAQVAGQWRGDTALTLPLFWRRSTVSSVFFGRYPRSSLQSFVPSSPPLSPSLTSTLASVDVKQNHWSLFLDLCRW